MKNLNKLILLCAFISLPSFAQEAKLTGGLTNCNGVSSMSAIQHIDRIVNDLNNRGQGIIDSIAAVNARCGFGTIQERCAKAQKEISGYKNNSKNVATLYEKKKLKEVLGAKGADEPACLQEVEESVATLRENGRYLEEEYRRECLETTRSGCK